jgi:2-oxoglutarate dehydrogenase E1 component
MKEGYDTYFRSRERGTFHIVMLLCEDSEEEVILINNLEGENTGKFSIYNSLLSEYGVLGFDYGYALASPNI